MIESRLAGGRNARLAPKSIVAAILLCFTVWPAHAAGAAEAPAIAGVPVDFILFGLTLLGVALFHHHTLRVALTGLAIITLYKLGFTGFKSGAGIPGLLAHLGQEWVILTNLLCSSPRRTRAARAASWATPPPR